MQYYQSVIPFLSIEIFRFFKYLYIPSSFMYLTIVDAQSEIHVSLELRFDRGILINLKAKSSSLCNEILT